MFCALKPATVVGISRIDDAKIGGMTPETLSFSGRCEDSPPNILLPTCRLGYCTSSRRCARSMKTMPVTSAAMKAAPPMIMSGRSRRCAPTSNAWPIYCGKRATMPAKMISEMPLPTPRLVICSPIHISRIVPPVSVMTAGHAEEQSGLDDDMAPVLETDRDAVGLDRGQPDGAVARVLVDDLAARLAFFLQRSQARGTRSSSAG